MKKYASPRPWNKGDNVLSELQDVYFQPKPVEFTEVNEGLYRFTFLDHNVLLRRKPDRKNKKKVTWRVQLRKYGNAYEKVFNDRDKAVEHIREYFLDKILSHFDVYVDRSLS